MAICPALHYLRLRVKYMTAAAQRRGDRRVFILRPPRILSPGFSKNLFLSSNGSGLLMLLK